MKRLLLVLFILVSVSSAFAAELKVTGDMYVRGTTLDNLGLVKDNKDAPNASYFDYDLNLNMALVANENATVFVKLTYDKDVIGTGKVPFGSASADDASLAVERAYINYKFHPALQINTGLMAGGQWANAFGDTEINVMRVQAIGALSADMVFLFTYEKQSEVGMDRYNKDSEKDDQTVYYLSGVFKGAGLDFRPLLVYGQKGINNDKLYLQEVYDATVPDAIATTIDELMAGEGLLGAFSALATTRDEAAQIIAYAQQDATPSAAEAMAFMGGVGAAITETYLVDQTIISKVGKNKAYKLTTKVIDLGLNGDFGVAGFESEFVYKKVDTGAFADDHADLAAAIGAADSKTMGIYANLFAKVDTAKVGFVYAYGSADEKDGKYNWGDDFDVLTVMDDYIDNSNNDLGVYGLSGYSVYKLYADYTMDKLTAGIALAYGANNATKKMEAATYDSSFKEIDASVSYAFDANTTYTVAGGYAMTTNFAEAKTDADAYRVYHKFAVKF